MLFVMLEVHPSAAGSGMSLLVMLFLLLLIVVVGIWFYRNKSRGYDSVLIGSFSALMLFGVVGAIVMRGSFNAPAFPIILIEGIFLLVIFICFLDQICFYKRIVTKQHKTDDDIKKRQKIIRNVSYLLAISFASLPFLLNSWGLGILPSLEPRYFAPQEYVYLNFMENGIKLSLLMTILVFFVDHILSRIASEIYTYDDVKDMDNFCIYLRSFNIDKNNEERLICQITRNLYPVYAIGDPNKVLQPNGADRIYVTDKIWQDVVKDLSLRSNLILLRVGQTDGTVWEFTNIISSNLLKKVIFIVYNQVDYDFFTSKIKQMMGISMPLIDFSTKYPNAFYFIEDNDSIVVKQYKISEGKDVKFMLNEYLKTSPELAKKYMLDVDLRKHNLKYMFDNSKIPEKVRKSLNWGIISPVVNMRHWSLLVWGGLVFFMIMSVLINSFIPIYTFFFVMLLLGNRIEWAAGGWSGASIFLRHQRREAKLLWLSLGLGSLYSFVFILLHIVFR